MRIHICVDVFVLNRTLPKVLVRGVRWDTATKCCIFVYVDLMNDLQIAVHSSLFKTPHLLLFYNSYC